MKIGLYLENILMKLLIALKNRVGARGSIMSSINSGKKTVCAANQCVGCMACVDICSQDAIYIIDDCRSYNAIIDDKKCIQCGACSEVCQNISSVAGTRPIEWYQGWTNNERIRKTSSSGGFAMSIAETFIKKGGVVWSCVFQNGKFLYKEASTTDEARSFSGSKYVKSNPVGAYSAIRARLKDKKMVLFIGLPCHVAALYKYIGQSLRENLYTIDLICHGTPSPYLLKSYLQQYKVEIEELIELKFRDKTKFLLLANEESIFSSGVCDRYSLAFLFSLMYTENCYNCKYASLERVSDLTLGDSWGTDISYEQLSKGISLALCQTLKGKELIKQTDLHLESINVDRAIRNNHQLQHPSIKPKGWKKFFDDLERGRSFNYVVFKHLPWPCFKMEIKKLLIKLHILKHY